MKHIILASLARLVFVLAFIFCFPLLLINGIDYKRNLKKNPFYKSKFVALCEKYPAFFNCYMLFFSFPLFSKIYYILPDISGKVLQVGCGTGLLNRYYKYHKRVNDISEIINIDINIDYLKFGLKKKNMESYIHASIYSVPVKEKFDAIIFSKCFHHIRNHRKAFSECERLLNRKGVIIIIDPISLNENKKTYMTNTYIDGVVWRFNKDTFKMYLEENLTENLRIKEIKYIRVESITNYNFIYPHTDGLVIIEKV